MGNKCYRYYKLKEEYHRQYYIIYEDIIKQYAWDYYYKNKQEKWYKNVLNII